MTELDDYLSGRTTDLSDRAQNALQDRRDEAEAGPSPLEPGENPFDAPADWVSATIARFKAEGLI